MTACWHLSSPIPIRGHFSWRKFLVIGDLNLNEGNDSLQDCMLDLNLENVVKVPTCFKSDSPTCNDLLLTSDSEKLSNIETIETELSDFHAMVATVLKGNFRNKQAHDCHQPKLQ